MLIFTESEHLDLVRLLSKKADGKPEGSPERVAYNKANQALRDRQLNAFQ